LASSKTFFSFLSERYGKDTQPDADQKLPAGSNPDPARKEASEKEDNHKSVP
jgi:hypothetical protein